MRNCIWFILPLALLLALGSGCTKKKVMSEPVSTEPEKTEPAPEAQAEPVEEEVVVEVEETEPAPPTPMELYESEYVDLTLQHTVEKGECLWWIAEYKKIYNDPFMWPLIYKANKDKIDDPDLIYPDQTFYIPRSFELNELKNSREQAGAPKPYLPPKDANVPAEIRSELGWGF